MDIVAYILKYITKLKNGETDTNTLIQMFGLTLCSYANIEKTTDIDSLISTILTGYQNGLYSDMEAVNLLKMISTGDIEGLKLQLSSLPEDAALEEVTGYDEASYGSYYGGGGGGSYSSSSSKNDSDDVTTNIETDDLLKVIAEYENIESELMSVELTVPPLVATYATKLKTDINNGKKEISKSLTKLKSSIVEILNISPELDESVKDIDMDSITFENIRKVIYDRSKNSKPVEATAEFFKNNGCDVDGDIVKLTVKGKECEYNLAKHKLYIDNSKEGLDVQFYIPQNALDNKKYSKLNTYTFFSYKDDFKLINNQSTNSILVRVTKSSATNDFTKLDETAMATKFINKVAGTELNHGYRNVIAGDSKYGAYSLKIAAKNPKLYQTVCCVNNAAVIAGVNGVSNQKTGFDTAAEVEGLNGAEIVFINASEDPNINHNYQQGKNFYASKCSYEDSYTYTGLVEICKRCPNSNVTFIFNESAANSDAIKAFKGIDLANYSYDGVSYANLTDIKNTNHSSGRNIVYDLLNNLANYNDNI